MADKGRARRPANRDPLQKVLGQSGVHFQQLVAGVEDYAVILLGPDGNVTSWNAGAERIHGHSAEAAVGSHFSRFYTSESLESDWPARELRLAAEVGRVSQEGWQVRKDGTRFWASVVMTRLPTRGGEPGGFLMITRDLTERREAEERLRQSEERLRIIIQGLQEYAVFMLDPEGIVVSWNTGAQRIKGYEASEIVGRHFSCFYPQEEIDAGKPSRELRVALEKGFIEDEGWRITKTGERFWANVVITALYDQEGRHLGFAKVTRDLTDRMKEQEAARRLAEARLHASEERFARFTQYLPGLAWIKDLEGRYVYVNDSAASVFGSEREAIIGRTDQELFPPETAAQFRENDRLAQVAKTGIQVIEFLKDADGVVRHSIVSKFPIPDAEGNRQFIGGVAFDISERIQAEEALRLADRRKDEFLATLSHELRNPLAPIRNAVHLLREKQTGGPPDPIYEMMERQLVRMVRLVDDLLEVSRIAGGKIELRKEEVELNLVIQRALESSQPLIDAAGHNLILRLPLQAISIYADPIRLAQVISNLLDNAAKYTGPGGHIWLTARQEGDDAVIAVRDDGVGIPAPMLGQVFDMFAQVDRTLNRAQGGLGIGLALARSLVEMHGGHIEAHSDGLDQGSKFVVRMPVAVRGRRTERRAEPRQPSETQGPRRRILIVDDNQDGADSLGMVLRLLGADPHVVYDGPSALEAIRSHDPEVVLLDLGMPGMDGYEVATRLRADPAFSGLQLIALTGWGSEEERRRSREAGFDDHWVKPVEPEKLRQLVAENSTGQAKAGSA